MAAIAQESALNQARRPLALARPLVQASWHRLALAAILLLSAALEFIGLDGEGYANTYYAAAIKSMLTSWHNFFFASFDAGGFVSVDKPPLGLWVQAASARMFGFSGLSLLVPEALAGVLSVALLYRLVARPFGPVAGLLAALALALTPITAIVDRNNTIDSLLILTLLAAAWAACKAAETGRLRLLLLCAALIGLGFNIKMMQAYLVLPACGLVYLLGAPVSRRARLAHLTLAAVVCLAVSLSWSLAVDLTPPGARPYVSDSGSNSALSLALGYNGLGRVTQALLAGHPTLHLFGITIDLTVVPAFAPEIGNPGALRLFSPVLAEQASWLLPLALLGLLAAVLEIRPRLPLDRRGQALALWGGWLITAGIFFSTARFFHLYYLVMLAPAAASLAGIGATALWRHYVRAIAAEPSGARWRGWLLPAALLATAALQLQVLTTYSDWGAWPALLVAAGCLAAVLPLAIGLLRLQVLLAPELLVTVTRPWALVAATVGILALLIAPAAWLIRSVADGDGAAWLPQAGPAGGAFGPGGGAGFRFRGAGRGFSPGGPFAAPPGFGGANGQGVAPGGQTGSPPSQGGSGAPAGGQGFAPGSGQQGFAPGAGGQRFGFGRRGGGFGGGALTFAGSQTPTLDPKLLAYLRANQRGAHFLVATTNSSYASLFILQTDQPAMALGGYQGWDHILTPGSLAQLVAKNTVRFFYIPAAGDGGRPQGASGSPPGAGASGSADATAALTQWVRANCSAVPTALWQSATSTGNGSFGGRGSGGGQALYSCSGTVRR